MGYINTLSVPRLQKVIQGEQGGIIPSEFSIHSSKVALVCPKCGKATRVGYEVEKDGKVRVCKKCGAKIK